MEKSPRWIAFDLLQKLELRKSRIDPELAKWFEKTTFDERDKAFVSKLVYGVTRWRRGLDVIIDNASSTPLSRIDLSILTLLRMGLYQIYEMSGVPISAAVNETVDLAKKDKKARHFTGFINGVLRGAIRKTGAKESRRPVAEVVSLLQKKNLPEHIALAERYSFPDWLAKKWVEKHGPVKAREIMSESNKRAPMFFRLNRLKIARDEFESRYSEFGIDADRVEWTDNGYRLAGGKITPGSQLIEKGYIQPQDASSMVAANLLGAEPYDFVADICCGKGIKSGGFAQSMDNRGFILSVDNSRFRLGDLKQNMKRLGVSVCRPVMADTSLSWPTVATFGKIFVDAPCSGTGGLRRKPEGKWNKEPSIVSEMMAVQKRMLNTAVDMLAPDGALVYSVCSIEREEGVDQVERLLRERGDIERDDIRKTNPRCADFIDENGDISILPGDGGMDGFYVARLKKIGGRSV